jgi:hypothetical protein
LRRAKKKLGVVANRKDESGAWRWELADPENEEKAAS